MRPIHQYDTIRKGQIELRRQAEHTRKMRMVSFKKWVSAKVQKYVCARPDEQEYVAEKQSMV
ncbi:MAG TPA: hypothetical protein VKU38_09505 [Ktedonobacteraceae bacterium]|nr:hypothetical protein [Ktedonobacteraceae bacterium]